MKKPKLIRWSDDGYPPIDLNEQLTAVLELIGHSRSLESQVKELREALAEGIDQIKHMMDEPDYSKPSAEITLARISKKLLLNKQP